MNVLLVDDHPLFLSGLRGVLADLPGIGAIVEAADVPTALALLDAEPRIDCVCLDLNLPGADGFALLEQLATSDRGLPVAIVSASEQPATAARALAAGALAWIAKSASAEELRAAFAALARGEPFISPAMAVALADYRNGIIRVGEARVRITRRQREVLALLAAGHGNQAIAASLSLAESTVKAHVSTLFELLQVNNRAACARVATQLGLVEDS